MLFEIFIINLEAGFYFRMTPEKALAKADKYKKYRCLQECLEHRHHFSPLLFYADRIPGKEAWSSTRKMALHQSFKLKRKYSEMCGFVRASMALAVV